MSEVSLLKRATLAETCDAMVLPPSGRSALFVLAGYGGTLRGNCLLAEPREFSVNLKISAQGREYLPDPFDFRTMPGDGTLRVDLLDASVYRFDTPQHDYFRVFIIGREAGMAQAVESQLTPLAFGAAAVLSDWRLENVLEWCSAQRRAAAGEVRPEVGCKLPATLRWQLRKPVFRADQHDLHYLWDLASPADRKRQQRHLLSCVTDSSGTVTREADLQRIQRLFTRAEPLAAPARLPVDFSADPASMGLAMTTGEHAAYAAPVERRQVQDARQRAELDAQREKIRAQFEL